jgi:phospholipase C
VKAGDTLSEDVPLSVVTDGRYSIDVRGPNGFYRSFKGDPHSHAVQVQVAYEQKGSALTGNVEIFLHNPGPRLLDVTVRDNSYGTGTTSRVIATAHDTFVVLNLKRSYGWYDFAVETEGSQVQARFAGHVETGHPSFSDPLMGGLVTEGIA